MILRLLGTVAILGSDGWAPAGPAKRSLVLASLALAEERPLSSAALSLRLWGGAAPAAAAKTVAAHVSHLRRSLRDHEGVDLGRGGGDGYRLRFPADGVDVFAMRALVRRARAATEDAAAVRLWREAETLWHGEPLAGLDGDWARRTRGGLNSERSAYLAELHEAELRLGRHRELVGELETLVAEHPHDESLTERLMLALYRGGRGAEAQNRYLELRGRLRQDRGADPGEAVTELHRRILRQDPELSGRVEAAEEPAVSVSREPTAARRVAPAQLPADTVNFVGRGPQLERLLSESGVSVVDGMAGVGKTTLTVHAAHRLAPEFPDGQLFLDLHGFSGAMTPMSPHTALARLLRALGTAEADIPDAVDERAAAYRSRLAGTRTLVVLDNVAESAQVVPLLPGAPGCRVLISSRRSLAALDDARLLSLSVLSRGEAVDMFDRISGRPESPGTAATVAEIVELCGRLPLALRLAAARLRSRPNWSVTGLRDRLADETERLTQLRVERRSVAAAFAVSYRELGADHRRLFRRLGLTPTPDLPVAAVAALDGRDPDDTRALLSHLEYNNLVDLDGDRCHGHDLLRLFAAEHGETEDAETDRRRAVERLYDWYHRSACLAAERLIPENLWLPPTDTDEPATVERPATADSARSWFETELSNLSALARSAERLDVPSAAWRLTDALRPYLSLQADRGFLAELATAGLAAARRHDGGPLAEGAMWFTLARAKGYSTEQDEARRCRERALESARAAGNRYWEANLLDGMAYARMFTGDMTEALRFAERALESRRADGGRALDSSLCVVGSVRYESGLLAEAARDLSQAVELCRRHGNRDLMMNLYNLADIHWLLGDLAEARRHSQEALRECRAHGDRRTGLMAATQLGLIDLTAGHRESARAQLRHALDEAEAEDSIYQLIHALGAHVMATQDDSPKIALPAARRSLELSRELGMPMAVVTAAELLARTHLRLGELDAALPLARQALESARHHRFRTREGIALTTMAEIRLAEGDAAAALDAAESALANQRDTGHRPGAARTHEVLAAIHARRGDADAAAEQWRAAAALYRAMDSTDAERAIRRAEAVSGSTTR